MHKPRLPHVLAAGNSQQPTQGHDHSLSVVGRRKVNQRCRLLPCRIQCLLNNFKINLLISKIMPACATSVSVTPGDGLGRIGICCASRCTFDVHRVIVSDNELDIGNDCTQGLLGCQCQLTELYTRENQCDNLLHHHHQHHHHLRTCFAFVWLEVIASRSKLLSQHCSVGGMSWTGLHQHRI